MPGTANGGDTINGSVVRSWVKHAGSVHHGADQNRPLCCMVCLMPQSQVSGSFKYSHFNMFSLDRPTCVRNRLSAFQVVQRFSSPAGKCSSALMLRCTLASRGSSRSLHASSFRRRVDGLNAFEKNLPRFQA